MYLSLRKMPPETDFTIVLQEQGSLPEDSIVAQLNTDLRGRAKLEYITGETYDPGTTVKFLVRVYIYSFSTTNERFRSSWIPINVK
jgi:hypothetical protein